MCGDQTHWRIDPADAHLVPADDCPESWGRREEWLAQVRRQRRRELAQNVGDYTGQVVLLLVAVAVAAAAVVLLSLVEYRPSFFQAA